MVLAADPGLVEEAEGRDDPHPTIPMARLSNRATRLTVFRAFPPRRLTSVTATPIVRDLGRPEKYPDSEARESVMLTIDLAVVQLDREIE